MESQKQVKQTPENYIKELRRKTRRVFSTEQKISIVVEGMRAETSVREICRKYGIAESLFYKWNKEFFEAGKQRLSGDEVRQATSDEVLELRKENARLKEALADLMLRTDILKKTMQYLG
ncbi:transposase [Niabella drilacis]|uniref:Transposase n=1 Tax=Niabella drilacis (strain DSM 25811 / CCM 8410 / CCUG 62505 / LMG 26954 / E90) TaxID=1285928 RepID=A0A1G6UT51_NIADE|nr:transposase [Niabella drilacis]